MTETSCKQKLKKTRAGMRQKSSSTFNQFWLTRKINDRGKCHTQFIGRNEKLGRIAESKPGDNNQQKNKIKKEQQNFEKRERETSKPDFLLPSVVRQFSRQRKSTKINLKKTKKFDVPIPRLILPNSFLTILSLSLSCFTIPPLSFSLSFEK